jgi:hypothetical protein
MLTISILACSNHSPNVSSIPDEPEAPKAIMPDLTDAKRLSDGATKLMDAMDKPTTSFHFSFSGQVNLNQDKTQSPQVGPVALQAEVSPDQISLTETRGSIRKTATAKRHDETNWAMANVTTLGLMTSPNFVIALGSTAASPPSTDVVGATFADKFTFDTAAVLPSQKLGLAAARAVLPTIKDCRGTAWIAEDSGLLIKFNIDADFLDQNHHAWKEHYEGSVTPK